MMTPLDPQWLTRVEEKLDTIAKNDALEKKLLLQQQKGFQVVREDLDQLAQVSATLVQRQEAEMLEDQRFRLERGADQREVEHALGLVQRTLEQLKEEAQRVEKGARQQRLLLLAVNCGVSAAWFMLFFGQLLLSRG